jgi:hypothetical protein
MTRTQPRVYADFNNADKRGRLRLNCRGTNEDLHRQKVELAEGMPLTVYMEDIECAAVATFSKEENLWVAVVDWNVIRDVNKGEMKMGLAGSGVKGDWHVEIDELIGLGLYGITIGNRQFSLQLSEAPATQIHKLLGFLKARKQDEGFEFRRTFGGEVGFVHHDGAVFIRIVHRGEHGPNLLEISVDHSDCDDLCAALEQAILNAGLPE